MNGSRIAWAKPSPCTRVTSLLVVESQDVNTRFLLKQLFVHKAVDSSWPWRAFLATMVAAWRAAESATGSGQIKVTDPAVFLRIAQLARWVSSLGFRPVSEVELDVKRQASREPRRRDLWRSRSFGANRIKPAGAADRPVDLEFHAGPR